MGIINKYTIWAVGEGKELFTEMNNNGDYKALSLDLFGDGIKEKFTKEEIDYITSGFYKEKDFVDYLSSLSLYVNPTSHIEITHKYNGIRKDKPIYGNKYLHKFAKEVIDNKKKDKQDPYELDDSDELHKFVNNILNNCDIDFLLGCRKEIISPKLLLLLSAYSQLKSEADEVKRNHIANEIYGLCKKYEIVRKMIVVQQDLRSIRYVNKDSADHLNAKMYQELFSKPLKSKRLQELYGDNHDLNNVFKNMSAIDLLTCDVDDLRKIGILPLAFTAWEYLAYQKAHPEMTNAKGQRFEILFEEDEPYSNNVERQQIDNPLLNSIYERYSNGAGEIDYETLFNDISVDDIYSNPENYEDLVAMGLIPEGTEKEDVFGPSKK